MSAVCPACGVPVVPGYVKCPKCHAALPYGPGRRPGTSPIASATGTSVEDRGFPFLAVIVPVAILLVIVVIFAMRGGEAEPEPETEAAQPAQPTTQAVQQTAQAPIEQTPPAPAGPDPRAAAADLERALRRQRLWSSVEVSGARIDVRSASCGDAAMTAALDGAAPTLRNVGLTELRCLAESGAVVSERGL